MDNPQPHRLVFT